MINGMKKFILTLMAAALMPVLAMAQCPTPTTATATVTLKRVIPGLLDGNFSVSDTKKVAFSQGNLQYNSDEQKWQLATNQWDYIGATTGNTSITVDGKANNTGIADLFGWVGASSIWTGLKGHGLTSSTATEATDGYGNVSGESLKSDWGTLIGSGWRTLTIEEWRYLFNTDNRPERRQGNRYARANIHGVNGMILLPDGWTQDASAMSGTLSGINGAGFVYSIVDNDDWAILEKEGCVFLPAAGWRDSGITMKNVGTEGRYWPSSITPMIPRDADYISFTQYNVSTTSSYYRYYGCSVRLVRDVE